MGAQEQAVKGGMMRNVFKDYLARMASIENRKPEGERREVPLLEEIAEAVGVHPVTLSRIVNNQNKRLSLDLVSDTIAYMRRRGFSMQLNDFMVYEELESADKVPA